MPKAVNRKPWTLKRESITLHIKRGPLVLCVFAVSFSLRGGRLGDEVTSQTQAYRVLLTMLTQNIQLLLTQVCVHYRAWTVLPGRWPFRSEVPAR